MSTININGVASATTYWVNKTSGNDSFDGSSSSPWKTLNKSAWVAIAGDTVIVRQATAYTENFTVQNNGTVGNEIKWTTLPNETVTINGFLGNGTLGLIAISQKNNINISGNFRLTASNVDNIHIDNSTNVSIYSVWLNQSFLNPLHVDLSNGTFIYNVSVSRRNYAAIAEGISISRSPYTTVANSHIDNNTGECIVIKRGSNYSKVYGNIVSTCRVGIYVDAQEIHTHHVDIYDNMASNVSVRDGFRTDSEKGGLLEDINYYNNIANDTEYGFRLSSYADDGFSPQYNKIYFINNVAYKSRTCSILIDSFRENATNILVRNNIAYSETGCQINVSGMSENTTVDYNLIYGNNSGQNKTNGTHFVNGVPQFVSDLPRVPIDFRINLTSPARDNGSSILAPSTDFFGNPRPSGVAYDIGIHEYQLSVDTTITSQWQTARDNVPNQWAGWSNMLGSLVMIIVVGVIFSTLIIIRSGNNIVVTIISLVGLAIAIITVAIILTLAPQLGYSLSSNIPP